MSREYRDFPILSAGGVIIIDKKVLLIKRKTEPKRGKWSVPGGVINLGEKIEDGLKREILEETGLNVEVKELIDIIERVFKDNKGKIVYHYVILDYLCKYISGDMKASSDAEDLVLAGMDELNRYDVVDGMKSVIEKAYELIKK